MILSHSKKFIFVHIPKVAGRSIKSVLEPYNSRPYRLSTYTYLSNFSLKKPKFFSGCFHAHDPASKISKELPEKVFQNYFKFAFVRNPWERAVSIYFYILKTPNHKFHHIIKNMRDFEEYIDWLHEDSSKRVNTQKYFLTDSQGNIMVDFVGRYENLQQDFMEVCKKTNIPEINLPRVNNSRHKNYREYYNKSSTQKAENIFKEDIELFKYEF